MDQDVERTDLVKKITSERRNWDVERAQLNSKINQVTRGPKFKARPTRKCESLFSLNPCILGQVQQKPSANWNAIWSLSCV